MKFVRHATEADALRRLAAVDKALGYPSPATVRGSQCPPHPFGETVRYSVPVRISGSEWGTRVAPDEVVGRVERVDGRNITISNDGAREVDLDLLAEDHQ